MPASCSRNVQPSFILKALTEGTNFVPKISPYVTLFIISLTQISHNVPCTENQPQPWCFHQRFPVVMVFLGCIPAFFFFQARAVYTKEFDFGLIWPSFGPSRWTLVNFRLSWTCQNLVILTFFTNCFNNWSLLIKLLVQVCNLWCPSTAF